MATRKSRQNTESPIPSGTESVPTTPTTPATRHTRSIRNKQLQQGKTEDTPIQIKTEKIEEEEEAVKETTNNDEEVSSGTTIPITTTTTATATATTTAEIATIAAETTNAASENVEEKESTDQNEKEKESTPPAASTRKRRIAAAKEEPTTDKLATNSESVSPNTTDDGKTSPNKMKRSRRSAEMLLTDNKSESTPSILSKRRNSTGKIEKPTRKLSSRIKKLKQLRKTKMGRAMLRKPSEKIAVVVNKPIKQLIEKQATKGAKVEKSDSASDSEIMKMSRRRSDSVSKCSDMTDASSFQETKDSVEDLAQATESNDAKMVVKEEVADKDEASENKPPENESTETARSANDSGIGGDSDNSQAVKPEGEQTNDGKRGSRFSRRKRPLSLQRVMSTRSQSVTPKEVANETQDDDEDGTETPKEIKSENAETPLHIDTTVNETNAGEKLTPDTESTDKEIATDKKAKSLSPVLVSEGVSEISVKQFYGQADFLENNLGIEKDPKLGEIVQNHEKIKAGHKEKPADVQDGVGKTEKDCEKPSEHTKVPSESNQVKELDTSTESMDVDDEADDGEEEEEEDVEEEVIDEKEEKTDGAKCDEKDSVDCFVKPVESVRRDSATILNESLMVLNGEIELTSTKEKKEVIKSIEDDVGEVVLYKISNGMRMNPEKLETVLESQKIREKERSDSTESVENSLKNESEHKKDIQPADSIQIQKDEVDASKMKTKHDEPKRSISTETKAIVDSDTNKENLVKPAAVRSNSGSKDSRSSSLDDESPEERIQKESHLKTLGLLTHQAAEEATIEKQKQREKFKVSNKGKKNSEYTGTLKTVIKLHRGNNDKKKGNQPLKMTLHKGRAKNGSDKSDTYSNANSEEDTYYTIQQQDMDSIGKQHGLFNLIFE